MSTAHAPCNLGRISTVVLHVLAGCMPRLLPRARRDRASADASASAVHALRRGGGGNVSRLQLRVAQRGLAMQGTSWRLDAYSQRVHAPPGRRRRPLPPATLLGALCINWPWLAGIPLCGTAWLHLEPMLLGCLQEASRCCHHTIGACVDAAATAWRAAVSPPDSCLVPLAGPLTMVRSPHC